MSRVTQLKITGFYDNDNYLLNFTAKGIIKTETEEYANYLDNLISLWSQIYKNMPSRTPTTSFDVINQDNTRYKINILKTITIAYNINKILYKYISIYSENNNIKEADKILLLSQIYDKIKPIEQPKINITKWIFNFLNIPKTEQDKFNLIDDNIKSADLLNKINEIIQYFTQFYSRQDNILRDINTYMTQTNGDKVRSTKDDTIVNFVDYNIDYLKFRESLLAKQYNWPPIFKKEFQVSMASQTKPETIFYIPNNILLTNSNINEYISNIKELDKLNKQLLYEEERKKLEILKKKSEATNEYKNPKELLATVIDRINRSVDDMYKTSYISNKIKDINNKYPALRNLSNDEINVILENSLNIFLYSNGVLINNFKEFTKEIDKTKNTSDDLSKSTIFDKNVKVFIDLLNTLKFKTIIWGTDEDKEGYKFISPNFTFRNINEITNKLFNLELILNLERSFINSYIKYIINFISSDPTIKNINNYQFKLVDSLPNITTSDNHIYLPPLIYGPEITDPKDASCCFVLITKDDITKFNKNNPSISNKELFTNLDLLDKLIAQISNTTYNPNERYKNPEAFKSNIELITNIFFNPHPLKNMFTKFFSKNNQIFYQGKPYNIINLEYKDKGIPEVTDFEFSEIKKGNKQEIIKTYTVKIILTVVNAEKPLNLVNKIDATCPNQSKQFNTKYSKITDKIPFLKNIYKEEKIKDRWHLNKKGKLQKASVTSQSAGSKNKTKKKYIYYNMKDKIKTKKYKKNKNYKKNKFSKKYKKNKNKYTRKNFKYKAGVTPTGKTKVEDTQETGKPRTPSPQLNIDDYGYRLDSDGWHADSEFGCFGCESGTDVGAHCVACERERFNRQNNRRRR
jgi:hypothetical protein